LASVFIKISWNTLILQICLSDKRLLRYASIDSFSRKQTKEESVSGFSYSGGLMPYNSTYQSSILLNSGIEIQFGKDTPLIDSISALTSREW
jgi:hypothetical protein